MSHRQIVWLFALAGARIWFCDGISRGQTTEIDTTVTGPRGRSIERQVEVQRTPGGVERSVQVTRPGGTIERQTTIQRMPARGPWRGGPGPGGWGRPAWVPRPVLVNPGPAIGLGLLTAPVLNFSFGGGGGGVIAGPGGPIGGPVAPPPPPDTVALEAERLKSLFSGTRKDAAFKLGQTGDPRAIPSLIHVLKYDTSRDVRVAAAISLGEIGGNEAAMALEKVAIYDHKEEVRTAASSALARLNAKLAAGSSTARGIPANSGRPVVAPRRSEVVPESSGSETVSETPGAFTPPPPPTPVPGGSGGGR